MGQTHDDTTPSVYHTGEIEVQRRAGVYEQAQRIGRSIRAAMPPVAQAFLREQSVAVIGAADSTGRVWASLFSGRPGFLIPLDAQTVRIGAALADGDPLAEQLDRGSAVGLLAIDLANRQRMRLNGVVERRDAVGLVIGARQVYSNCPRYIQVRELADTGAEQQDAVTLQHGHELSPAQQRWVATADTFFIATAHPEGGADASHRGGAPGFVQVTGAASLVFPDYAGNTMFQTLGNIAANPQTGLLLVDWERGSTLQLTGAARVIWEPAEAMQRSGAERAVEVQIHQVIERSAASSLRPRGLAGQAQERVSPP